MRQQLLPALRMLLVLTVLTGVVYPLAVTGVAQLAFPHQAGGSLLYDGDRVVGSELIGQSFSRPEYFWGRLSATGPVPYQAAASTGSNYGPLNPQLSSAAEQRLADLRASGLTDVPIPVDLVTSSGSGLDPNISPAAAACQIGRVSRARRLPEETVRQLVLAHTQGRQFGLLGESRVHVLSLNLALDKLSLAE
ncbi:MAG: potassium-transporting ATPase subunit KdpC [Pirellulales bacterium]